MDDINLIQQAQRHQLVPLSPPIH
ncbi:BnaC03g77930D [Brassica napus]|uniref:BnaC03g77930D protein n=1 Tax=Brassica napus TaxID=3708 RepID=A0A078IPJ2_BRANA|nr:BnaC03g77930D [Brassica napus]